MTAVKTQPVPVTDQDASPLAAALAAFQAEMPTVPKTKTADTGSYRYNYADLADVTGAAMPLLTAQGLSFSTVPRYTEHGYELVGVLLHSSGESMEGALPIHGQSAQQLGSAITYARRYLFGCMTGVVTDDDDDGRAASKPPRKAAAKKVEEPPRAPGGAWKTQIQRIGILMSELGIKERGPALDYVQGVIGRRVDSRNDLTENEARDVIRALETRGVGVSAPAPRSPVDPFGSGDEAAPPTAEPPPKQGPTGPPGPAGLAAEYPAPEPGAHQTPEVHEARLPEPPEPDREPPVRPPLRVTAPTAERIKRLLARELGDVATEAEEVALLSAVLGYPVESIAALTREEGQRLGGAFNRFADGSLRWDFDLNDESPVPGIIITEPPAASDGDAP